MTTTCPCAVSSPTSGAQGIVIIGDTAEAFIFASNLIKYKLNIPIYILVMGVNRLDCIPDLVNPNFPINHLNLKLMFFEPTKMRYAAPGANVLSSNAPFRSTSNVAMYYTGQGPCGNYTFIPMMDFGPWFDGQIDREANDFIKFVTQEKDYTAVETTVTNYLKATFNLATYSNQQQGTYQPAVTYQHRFLRGNTADNKTHYRNYFQYFYDIVKKEATCSGTTLAKIYTEVNNLTFTMGSAANLYNLSFVAAGNTPVVLTNMEITWKTFHPSYQRIATLGGLNPNRSKTPATYRSVIPMSLAAANLTNVVPDSMTITSRGAFSLPDLSTGPQSVIAWFVHYYTTQQDIVTNNIADSGMCLLVIESMCRCNLRDLTYNPHERENVTYLNNPETECRYMNDFHTIVSAIYTGYTGQAIPTFYNTAEVCQDGVCISNKYYTSQPDTQVIPLIALNTIINVYGKYLYANNIPGAGTYSN
jgi:hypothetical protein